MTHAESRQYLVERQYKTEDNLAARQSIYVFQQPRTDIWNRALDEAVHDGRESVLDVGCGNGTYLGALEARGHTGFVAGMDLSPGMLTASRRTSARARLMLADAQQIPFPSDSFDIVLAMHMLYHVPDRARGITEMRRVLRPGGTLLAVTNSDDHLRELDEIVVACAGRSLPSNRLTFTLESGAPELRASFDHVERRDYASELIITEVEPVLAYVQSMRSWVAGVPGGLAGVVAEIEQRVQAIIDRDGAFRVRTAAGCFVCR